MNKQIKFKNHKNKLNKHIKIMPSNFKILDYKIYKKKIK